MSPGQKPELKHQDGSARISAATIFHAMKSDAAWN